METLEVQGETEDVEIFVFGNLIQTDDDDDLYVPDMDMQCCLVQYDGHVLDSSIMTAKTLTDWVQVCERVWPHMEYWNFVNLANEG